MPLPLIKSSTLSSSSSTYIPIISISSHKPSDAIPNDATQMQCKSLRTNPGSKNIITEKGKNKQTRHRDAISKLMSGKGKRLLDCSGGWLRRGRDGDTSEGRTDAGGMVFIKRLLDLVDIPVCAELGKVG